MNSPWLERKAQSWGGIRKALIMGQVSLVVAHKSRKLYLMESQGMRNPARYPSDCQARLTWGILGAQGEASGRYRRWAG